MQLLGWMHRKLMQNSIDPMKNPTIGTATTLSDESNYYMDPTRMSHSNIKFKNSSSYSETTKFEEPFEPFDFLSIGTFGMELLNTEPPTPTLPMSIEDLTDQRMEITENDLNMINHELEKFLDAEETEFNNDTSERSSHASIITLSYKPIEGADSEGHVHMAACPLQNYLFAASVELVETDKEVKKERASLGELFKRSNMVQEDTPIKKFEGAEQQSRKGNIAHFMKKVVKKFHSSSSSCTNSDSASSNSTKKKLSKNIVKMFHKKVYPEEMTEKQWLKLSKGRNKSNSHEDIHNKFDESENKRIKKKTIKLSWAGICKGASPVNAGHWIKTDSDYLVLEL
ncbi:hypothetical protein C2S51_018840 [Perilla frutescens var. frutescens]|nr:hypothetical protein C2S51_018840 [Perilla frutescens var. frutescens]